MTLDHINIVVRDIESAKVFFGHFGYTPADEADLHGEWISRVVGLDRVEAHYAQLVAEDSPVRIELICYHHPTPPAEIAGEAANRIGYRHIAFSVNDIEAEVDRLSSIGIVFLSGIHTYPKTGKRIVYGRGPEGILFELAQYGR